MPDQPSPSQTLLKLPFIMNPGLQKYRALPPIILLTTKTRPFSGSGRGPQSGTAGIIGKKFIVL